MSDKEVRPRPLTPPLEPRFWGIQEPKPPKAVQIPIVRKDLEQEEIRRQIAQRLKEVFAQKPLKQRMDEFFSIYLGNESDPSFFVSSVVRLGFLEHVPDDALLTAICPQGSGSLKTARLTEDPLWKEVGRQLNSHQIVEVNASFKALERFIPIFNDASKGLAYRGKLGTNQLVMVSDARQVTPQGWAVVNGLGVGRGKMLFNAFRKL